MGIKKIVFLVIVVVLIIIIRNRYETLKITSSVNEQQMTENYNIQLQQKEEIEEQNKQFTEQERIKDERIEKERIIKLEKFEFQLNENLNSLYYNLNIAQKNLNTITGFELSKHTSESEGQINNAQSQIDLIKDNIMTVEEELIQINNLLEN